MSAAPRQPGPRVHRAALGEFAGARFDEIYVGQVGGSAGGFFEFHAGQVLPRARPD
jgi:hypothetical protein